MVSICFLVLVTIKKILNIHGLASKYLHRVGNWICLKMGGPAFLKTKNARQPATPIRVHVFENSPFSLTALPYGGTTFVVVLVKLMGVACCRGNRSGKRRVSSGWT